ncbi:MAG: Uma2 family endonuclease [Candidatus Competibacteraceae bacterium]|jgi:Uma2 family endonuclease|nr:Uma2 family endonuclease [Candidatus Competibacteraceae bacterium]
MQWQELCDRPDLQNLPFKIELDEYGRIIMSPVKLYHSLLQGEIAGLLRLYRRGGKVFAECAIQTSKGTKVADVAWASQETFQKIKDDDDCSVSPELCVEVVSASNTQKELEEKKQLYFERGAQEVWFCPRSGKIQFYDCTGKISQSTLFPEFPIVIDIDA